MITNVTVEPVDYNNAFNITFDTPHLSGRLRDFVVIERSNTLAEIATKLRGLAQRLENASTKTAPRVTA